MTDTERETVGKIKIMTDTERKRQRKREIKRHTHRQIREMEEKTN